MSRSAAAARAEARHLAKETKARRVSDVASDHTLPGDPDGPFPFGVFDPEALRDGLRDILLIESGRGIRHNMTDEEMWQAMTDIARTALKDARDE